MPGADAERRKLLDRQVALTQRAHCLCVADALAQGRHTPRAVDARQRTGPVEGNPESHEVVPGGLGKLCSAVERGQAAGWLSRGVQ